MFDLQRGMINGGHQQHGIWGNSRYTGQLTPATAHAFHARDAPQSKLSFHQLRQHGTESSSLSPAAVPSGECRWTSARGNTKSIDRTDKSGLRQTFYICATGFHNGVSSGFYESALSKCSSFIIYFEEILPWMTTRPRPRKSIPNHSYLVIEIRNSKN